MYVLYRLIIGLSFYGLLPFLLVYVLITGKHREGLSQRLGLYPAMPKAGGKTRIWLHAASVGEVKAARALITELRLILPQAEFLLTTMTLHGRRVAERQLSPGIPCLLAPLDVPGVVGRVLTKLDPDIYVCLETELWPLLLKDAAHRGIRVVQVNGRLSEKAATGYRRWRWFFRRVLANFDAMAVISEADRKRYLDLGAVGSRLAVLGNVKYDLQLPDEPEVVRRELRRELAIEPGMSVLVAGSTHTGEEEMLLPLFRFLIAERRWLIIIAPRHLERLEALKRLFEEHEIDCDSFSALQGGAVRRHPVVILDSLGELAAIYSIATYAFCGGSLVQKNGHNLMEAAIWDRVVFYGPSLEDFSDAAQLLESVGGGCMVRDAEDLKSRILAFEENPEKYETACRNAGRIARGQLGAAKRQARLVIDCLGC